MDQDFPDVMKTIDILHFLLNYCYLKLKIVTSINSELKNNLGYTH